MPCTIPVLLLKTKSEPSDGYEEYFSRPPHTATFVPVLEHRPNAANLAAVRSLLSERRLGPREGAEYGGMIFTSQRAVEGFAGVVRELANGGGREVTGTGTSESTVGSLGTSTKAAGPTKPSP